LHQDSIALVVSPAQLLLATVLGTVCLRTLSHAALQQTQVLHLVQWLRTLRPVAMQQTKVLYLVHWLLLHLLEA